MTEANARSSDLRWRKTAHCNKCRRIRRAIGATPEGSDVWRSHHRDHGQPLDLPTFARVVRLTFVCGHTQTVITTLRNLAAIWAGKPMHHKRREWLEDQLEEIIS